ncbi:unnamed protein product [Boreogadus saida]
MALEGGKIVVLAALGRPFSLGMLYDCRNDSLIPGVQVIACHRKCRAGLGFSHALTFSLPPAALTLWDREALEKEAKERPQLNSEFEIVESDSIEDKSSTLNVEASLKASFLFGLIQIGGSAKYLSDSKVSRNQARVTIKYKTTTKFQQLSMNHIGRENEDRQDIEGNLKWLIKKIHTLKKEGQGYLNMAEKFSCKYHGDFILEKHPGSFSEAIEVYENLPKMLGTKGENAVPLKNIMARKLPLIRGGGEEESVLAKILKKVNSSPFKSGELNEWMDCKETEIKIISSLIDKMPNKTIVTSRSTLYHEIHSGDITHAVCFVFTSLETPEPYLSALSNYLDQTQPDDVPCAYDVAKEPWFSSNITCEKIKIFKDFAEANKENKSIRFLATAISDNEKKGATLHLYKDGSLVTDNFEPPSKPEMIPGDITHNSVTLNISPPRFGLRTVTHYNVEFCVHDVWHQQMESQAGEVHVSGLKMNEEYRFRCRANCTVGHSPAGEALIKTLPSNPLSPPEYIDLLIEREKSQARPGYQDQIKELQLMREKVDTRWPALARGDKLL